MTRLTIFLSALIALLLWPAVALAQSPDISDLVTSWGNWPLFVGVAVSLAIEFWKRIKPQVFDRFSPIAKRLVPLLVAGLGSGSAALVLGASWSAAGFAVLAAWGTALATGDTLRATLDLMLKKSGAEPAPVAELPANAKPKNPPLSDDELPPAA
jgi:hypothetical protein